MTRLSVRVIPCVAGGYMGFCPHLPGCVGRGDSYEAAVKALTEAMRGYLAAVGETLPLDQPPLIVPYVPASAAQAMAPMFG